MVGKEEITPGVRKRVELEFQILFLCGNSRVSNFHRPPAGNDLRVGRRSCRSARKGSPPIRLTGEKAEVANNTERIGFNAWGEPCETKGLPADSAEGSEFLLNLTFSVPFLRREVNRTQRSDQSLKTGKVAPARLATCNRTVLDPREEEKLIA